MNNYIILTRPAGKNQALKTRLEAEGFSVSDMPAMLLSPLPLAAEQIPDLARYKLVFFVSGYAVQVFFNLLERHGLQWPPKAFAGAVGAATTEALLHKGVPAGQIIAPDPGNTTQDSEAFFDELQKRGLVSFSDVLVVRGQSGRQWLADKLSELHVRVDFLPVYQRTARSWSQTEKQEIMSVLQADRKVCWLLTSNEGVDSIFNELKHYHLMEHCFKQRFVVTHPRIAEYVLQLLQKAANSCKQVDISPDINLCQPNDESIFEILSIS